MEASPKFQFINNNTVAVKVALNEDLRRFTFDGDFSALCREISSMFQLGATASFTLKYKDNDEDLITLCNDRDLAEAKRVCESTLKLTVLRSTAPPSAGTTETVEAKPDKDAAKEVKAAEREPKEKMQKKKALKEAKKEKEDKKKPAKDQKLEKPMKEDQKVSREERERRQKQKEQKKALKEAKVAAKEHQREEKALKKASKEAEIGEPPKAKKLEARFVKDITLEDGTEVQPGASLVKTWRFRNEGNKTWPTGSKLVFVSKLKGDIMGAPEEVLAPIAEPETEVDVSVPMVAPTAPGRYVGFWRLCTAEGKKFGQRVRVLVYVPAASSSDSSTAEEVAPKKKKDAAKHKDRKDRKEAAATAAAVTTTEVTSELLDKVAQLEKLGFANKRRNTKLLQKFGGDLSVVVNKLVLRQQKEKKRNESPKKKNDDM